MHKSHQQKLASEETFTFEEPTPDVLGSHTVRESPLSRHTTPFLLEHRPYEHAPSWSVMQRPHATIPNRNFSFTPPSHIQPISRQMLDLAQENGSMSPGVFPFSCIMFSRPRYCGVGKLGLYSTTEGEPVYAKGTTNVYKGIQAGSRAPGENQRQEYQKGWPES
jgi:hypothetical protein